MKTLENETHNERLCFTCYNWKSANSLAIDANYSNSSNLGSKTSLASLLLAASLGNRFMYWWCLYISLAPLIPFMFPLPVVKMDYLLLAGCYSVSPFVLTIPNHQWWEGGEIQIQKSLEFLVLLLSSLAPSW